MDQITPLMFLAGQALANSNICTGYMTPEEVNANFGHHRRNITRDEINAAQAMNFARVMLKVIEDNERGGMLNG